MTTLAQLDSFTRAYIEAALWSSTEYAYGECPCCGIQSILSHYPEEEYDQVPMCAREGCGSREIANPDPMDSHYSASDLAQETLEKIVADCAKFQAENETPDYGDRGACNGGDSACAGHDFWLTRNGHGVGFWDRSELDEGTQKRLTAAAKSFGECSLYVGEEGKLWLA